MEELESISSMEQGITLPFKWTGRIYSVSEITYHLKEIVETEFPVVCVRGQVSNISRASSGHIYFSLKDERALLSVVWFRSHHCLSPVGISDALSNKMEILCIGRMTIYPPSGTHQLIAEYVVDIGLGTYYLQLEALKKRLREKGYFSRERKKTIPRNPSRVAVITSPNGAAIRDFLKILKEKGVPCRIRIYPCSVQGLAAEKEIISMIKKANEEAWAQLVVIIRGGGSLEDLMVFNSEGVADAIFHSCLPVITGIGHEIDTTIADMTADYRCATPTHVANFLWDGREYYLQTIDEIESRLLSSINTRLYVLQNEISRLTSYLKLLSPVSRLNSIETEWTYAKNRLRDIIAKVIEDATNEVRENANRLFDFTSHPLFQSTTYQLRFLGTTLLHRITHRTEELKHEVNLLGENLKVLDPYLPLKRGYAIIVKENKIIGGIKEVMEGDIIKIKFADGRLTSRVISREEEEDDREQHNL